MYQGQSCEKPFLGRSSKLGAPLESSLAAPSIGQKPLGFMWRGSPRASPVAYQLGTGKINGAFLSGIVD
jgi:hypothetical protein